MSVVFPAEEGSSRIALMFKIYFSYVLLDDCPEIWGLPTQEKKKEYIRTDA